MLAPTRRSELNEWTGTTLGQALIEQERAQLAQLLSRFYGPIAIQFGAVGFSGFMEPSNAVHQILAMDHPLTGAKVAAAEPVRSLPEAMPFGAKTASIILLPHVLEFSADPHQVLREAARVLVPEGHLVLVGFNPFSLWGIRRVFGRLGSRDAPWGARFYPLWRIKEWLSVLGFEVVAGSAVDYLPPVKAPSLRHKLGFLQNAGARWWPMGAAVFMLVAKKREIGLTPIAPAWRHKKRLAPGLADPVTRNG